MQKDDLISRQAAIEAVSKGCAELRGVFGSCEENILALPSAQPGWIPVTERLPKPNEYENNVRQYYLVQNEYGDMMVCSWDGCCWKQMYCNTHVKDKVTAWMPLPTPYREGRQDGKN